MTGNKSDKVKEIYVSDILKKEALFPRRSEYRN